MLEAFEAATASRPPAHVHVEYFKAKEKPAAEGGFEVKLARSNRTISVQAGKTILDALLDAGITANYACAEGVCGTCETRVIEGIPDHRDLFLSKEEQAENKTIMICCSGSKSSTLVFGYLNRKPAYRSEQMKTVSQTVGASLIALCLSGPAFGQTQRSMKIGILNDASGPYSDNGGEGSVTAAKMAAEDFMQKHPGLQGRDCLCRPSEQAGHRLRYCAQMDRPGES